MITARKRRRTMLEGNIFSDIWTTISQGVPQAVSTVIGEVSHSASTQIQQQLGIIQQPPATVPPAIVVSQPAPIPTWVYLVPVGILAIVLLKKKGKATATA